MKDLVIFDLDKTLIRGYSQKLFLNYLFKRRVIKLVPYFIISIWFIGYKIGVIKNPKKIMEYAFSFAKGWDVKKLDSLVNDFFEEKLKYLIFREGIEVIKRHKAEGRELLIVSSIIDFLAKRIAIDLGINNYIGTRLEVINGRLTGKIIGDIIYGENKAQIVKRYISQNKLTLNNSWAYCDHISDLSILELVRHPFAVNPSSQLRKTAERKGWPIVLFNN